MSLKRTSSIALILMLGIFLDADAVRYPSLSYPNAARSITSVDGADAVFFNPAIMKANTYPEMRYYHSFNDSTFNGDNGIVFSRGGLGAAYYRLRLGGTKAVNSWTLAFASRYGRRYLVGSSYTFYKTDRPGFHNDHFWKVGVVYRPDTKLSLGAVANNLNRMEFDGQKTSVEYTIGGGIRPIGDKLTLAGDYLFYSGEKFKRGTFTAYASLKLKEGMWLSGHADENKFFGLGLSLAFGKSYMQSYAYFNDDPDFLSGMVSYGYSYNSRGYALSTPNRYAVLKLSGKYPEERQRSFLWQKENRTFSDLILGLDRIRNDDHIKGLALYLDHPKLGFAQLEELRTKINEIRDRGKKVVCFMAPLAGTGTYYLASAADKIAMQRLDRIDIVGLMAEVTFYKGTLDKLGIDVELEHIGKYKSASELVTSDTMSVYYREAIDALLDDMWGLMTREISSSRDITADSIKALIDSAPIASTEALSAGLVDTLIYPDEFEEWAQDQMGEASPVSFREYAEIPPYDDRWGEPPHIAVIAAEGSIVDGASSSSLFTGKILGSKTLNEAIRRARLSNTVKAVVLRVNSPGGQVLGSESIWRELKLTQQKKPVIVSMGNVAASGGYHISSASDYIFTDKMTATGSIGVIYGKVDMSGLREKIGFNTYLIKRGENADFFSSARGYTDRQLDKVRDELQLVYDDFVRKVADNRGLTIDEVDRAAQGRVWSGRRAIDYHLVDQIGGISDAIDWACRRVNVSRDDADIDIVPTRDRSVLPNLQPLALAAEFIQYFANPSGAEIPTDICTQFGAGYYYRSPYDLTFK